MFTKKYINTCIVYTKVYFFFAINSSLHRSGMCDCSEKIEKKNKRLKRLHLHMLACDTRVRHADELTSIKKYTRLNLHNIQRYNSVINGKCFCKIILLTEFSIFRRIIAG